MNPKSLPKDPYLQRREIPSRPSLSNRLGAYIGPVSVGIAYSVSKMSILEAYDSKLLYLVDFRDLLLVGILLGMTLRPIAQRIYWKRPVNFVVFSYILIALGPTHWFFEKQLGDPLNVLVVDRIMVAEVGAILVASCVAALVFVPRHFEVDFFRLRQRLSHYCNKVGIMKLASISLCYSAGTLLVQSALQSWEQGEWGWSLIEGQMMPALAWLAIQGVVLTLALLPLMSVLQGGRYELIFVLSLLVFIVSDFIPYFMILQTFDLQALLLNLLQELFLDILFCSMLVSAFKYPRKPNLN